MDNGMFDDLRLRVLGGAIGKPALVGIAAVLVLVAVLAAGRLIGTATANEFSLDTAAQAQQSPQPAEEKTQGLFVHVSGFVANPGLYELNGGARVADAVHAAGGFKEEAAVDAINLARPVQDGEQIHVPALQSNGEPAGQPSGEQAGTTAPAAGAQQGGPLNINQATAEELEGLPGIGSSTAAKIVADRKANGPFASLEDLKRVSGIGDKKLEALSGLVCV